MQFLVQPNRAWNDIIFLSQFQPYISLGKADYRERNFSKQLMVDVMPSRESVGYSEWYEQSKHTFEWWRQNVL